MTTLGVREVVEVYWREIAKKCNRATVFIENAAAECLHWSGGLALLETAGGIREFSSFESAGSGQKKAVFIVANPANRLTERTIKNIIGNSKLEYCIVISWCQQNVLSTNKYPARDFNSDDKSGNEWLEDSLLDWMGNRNFTAEVFYYPIFLCIPSKKTFFTPSYVSLFPLLSDDLVKCAAYWRSFNPGLQVPGTEADQAVIYPEELKSNIRQLIANFHSLFASLQLKEDIWSVGPFAKSIGDELESWVPARNRRKTAAGSVSLVLVDRTVDLAGTVIQQGESVIARILESHQNLEGHTLDVEVDLSKLLGVASPSMFVPSSLASTGCIESEEEEKELGQLFFSSEKEVIASLHKSLIRGSPKKSEQGGKVLNLQGLVSDIQEYSGDLEAVMSNLASVSRAQALVDANNSQDIVKRKRLQSLATQFGPDINHPNGGVLEQITDLVLGRTDTMLNLTDILQLLVYVYSVQYTEHMFREDEEERLKSVLGEAILAAGKAGELEPVLLKLLVREKAEEMNELVALNMVNYIWTRLEGVQTYRGAHGRTWTLLDEDGGYRGALDQLLADIYHPERGEVSGLHHHAGGLSAMLRSGLGWLGGSTVKPHPRQNPWVIVFVVGGVTPSEIRQLQRQVEGTNSKLTVAGTSILTPGHTLDLLFNNNPLLVDN